MLAAAIVLLYLKASCDADTMLASLTMSKGICADEDTTGDRAVAEGQLLQGGCCRATAEGQLLQGSC